MGDDVGIDMIHRQLSLGNSPVGIGYHLVNNLYWAVYGRNATRRINVLWSYKLSTVGDLPTIIGVSDN